MSLRLLSTKFAKHGRYFLQSFWKREIYTNILEQQQNRTRNRLPSTATKALRLSASAPTKYELAKSALKAGVQSQGVAAQQQVNNGIFRFGQHARKLFVDNILNRCTTTYSEALRTQATKKLFYGDSAPFFALIGVSLASGAGVLTKEDELEGVCWEIREAALRLQHSWNSDDISETLNTDFNIDKLDVGPPIAKGCNAVVYAASFKSASDNLNESNVSRSNIESTDDLLASARSGAGDGLYNNLQQQSFRPELMSPMQNMSRFVHNFGGSVDNLQVYNQRTAATDFAESLASYKHSEEHSEDTKRAAEASSGAATGLSTGMHGMTPLNSEAAKIERYPLALKMMFNYDIQSNALSILRAMYKETVPARQRYINASAEEWERLIQDQTLSLPAHPNIVTMFGFFCDEVRNFPDGHLLYPIAQPQRINPLGYGRNMSLYLLMKRYDYSLRSFLDTQELSTRTKLLLLAQLFEAVAHINRYGIAHRDLKSDNILIDLGDSDSPPILVLSDFGCCLADKIHGLQIPFTSYDIDRGGNAALMAPEIINKQPGPFSVLNYSKADLWACGAIAYEIFGVCNPFYSSGGGGGAMSITADGQPNYSLRNNDYKVEDLPPLNDECPELVQQLIYNILNPNPSKRVSPDIAANVMQLFLWAPSKWLKAGGTPNSPEILQWLLSLTTKIMCEGRNFNGIDSQLYQTGRRTYVEYLLICSFLARSHLRRIRGALNWIQNVV